MEQDYKKLVDEKLEDALSHAVAAELQQERSMFGSEEEFCSWLEAQEHQRRQNRRRMVKGGLAAAAVFVCLLFALSGFFPPESILPEGLQSLLGIEESIASPGPDGEVTEENGSIVIGGDGNGNLDTWTATFASYEDIPEQYQEQIIWFEEMPEGYELVDIEINRNYAGIDFYYNYIQGKNEIVVEHLLNTDNKKKTAILNQYDYESTILDIKVYIKDGKYNTRYIYEDGPGIISIIDYGKIETQKIEAMIASVKTGWNRK